MEESGTQSRPASMVRVDQLVAAAALTNSAVAEAL